jgi:hypothetical protein
LNETALTGARASLSVRLAGLRSRSLGVNYPRAVPVTTRSIARLLRRGTDEPLAPIEQGQLGTVPGSHLGRVGRNLMLAGFAPDD